MTPSSARSAVIADEPRGSDHPLAGARAFGVALTQRLALGGRRELQRSRSSSRGEAAAQPKFQAGVLRRPRELDAN